MMLGKKSAWALEKSNPFAERDISKAQFFRRIGIILDIFLPAYPDKNSKLRRQIVSHRTVSSGILRYFINHPVHRFGLCSRKKSLEQLLHLSRKFKYSKKI